MKDFSSRSPSDAPVHLDGGFSPGAAAPRQAEQLARRMADDPSLRVRVPLRADGSPCTPEIHDGGKVVGRLSERAVEILVEDGRLALASETKWRRTLEYRAVEVAPRKPRPDDAAADDDSVELDFGEIDALDEDVTEETTEQITHRARSAKVSGAEPNEDSAMNASTSDRGSGTAAQSVSLPPMGSRITTREVADLFGHKGTSKIRGYIDEHRLTAERASDARQAPWIVVVDAKLLAELDKRGIPYEIEEEAYAESPEACTKPVEADTDEVVAASIDDLGGGWGPDDEEDPETSYPPDVTESDKLSDDEAGGDSLPAEAAVSADTREVPDSPKPPKASPKQDAHPFADTLSDAVAAVRQAAAEYDETPPLQVAGEMVRSAHYQACRVRELARNLLTVLQHEAQSTTLAEIVHDEARVLSDELEMSDRDLTALAERERVDRFTCA